WQAPCRTSATPTSRLRSSRPTSPSSWTSGPPG
ncbi:MAG: hypothetical protein AVDCRST_MAG13-1130, partial [uncultured Solirubrobacteraceae bacterium]